MKKLLLIFFIIISVLDVSYASNVISWNCKKSNIEYFENLLEDGSIFQWKQILTKDVYEVALKNLQMYCDGNTDKVLNTPIFANHLVDIMFRKLDGFNDVDYSYWVKVDETAKQRREILKENGKEFNTDPKKLVDAFKKTWWPPKDSIWNRWTLYSKYVLVCKELEKLGNIILTANVQDDCFQ